MPFTEPSEFTITVNKDNIDNAGNTNATVSLALQIKEQTIDFDLPGIENNQDVAFCGTNPVVNIGLFTAYGYLQYICQAVICGTAYVVDNESSLKIAAEYLGIKETQAYTVTLKKA